MLPSIVSVQLSSNTQPTMNKKVCNVLMVALCFLFDECIAEGSATTIPLVAAELERLVRHRPRARKRTNHVQLLPIAVRTIA